MAAATSKRPRPRKHLFKVGDRVRFLFGVRRITGVIVEDRGPIGSGGRQIYAVRAKRDLPCEPAVFEIPADELRAA